MIINILVHIFPSLIDGRNDWWPGDELNFRVHFKPRVHLAWFRNFVWLLTKVEKLMKQAIWTKVLSLLARILCSCFLSSRVKLHHLILPNTALRTSSRLKWKYQTVRVRLWPPKHLRTALHRTAQIMFYSSWVGNVPEQNSYARS